MDRRGSPEAGPSAATLTFVFSDIEGSTKLLQALGVTYDRVLDAHNHIIHQAALAEGGRAFGSEGDSQHLVFSEARAAVRAALAAQLALAAHEWPRGASVQVRMGIHTGETRRLGDDYVGLSLHETARIAAAGHGGQMLVSAATAELVRDALPEGAGLVDLGEHHLKDLARPVQIYQLDAPGVRHDFPALRGGTDRAEHLPARRTSFVGRQAEMSSLGQLLAETRLLTLTGPGGSGKTTLAAELARREAASYDDGAWFVNLQTVSQPSHVRAEIAHGLGLFDGPLGPAEERLAGYVADRKLLLVIDNFEQVIEAAPVVGALLESSPRSRIIATSRIPLHLSAEQEFLVRPLGLETTDTGDISEATRLFIDRARRVRPTLRLGERELGTIAEICRLLDGLPLAIELTAAKVSALTIDAIHDRLVARLPMPGGGARDLPDRQRTIEDTIVWSYDLLERPLQRLFVRLGAFAGSAELEQIDEVAGPADELGVDVLDGLVGLVERSLLSGIDDVLGGVRFGMLETIHAFAAARLKASGEEQAVRRRHAVAFADLAGRAGEEIPGREQGRWLDRLEADASNLRVATAFAIDTADAGLALGLVGNQWRSWLATGRLVEGRELVSAALSLPGAASATSQRVWALDAAGGIAYWSGDLVRATSIYEEQLALADELGDVRGQAWASVNLHDSRRFGGDAAGADGLIEAARHRFEQLDDQFALIRVDEAISLEPFSDAVADPGAIRPQLEAALKRFDAAADRDPEFRRLAHTTRGLIHLLNGDASGAVRYIVAAMPSILARREPASAALGLRLVPAGLLSSGLAEAAAIVHGGVESAVERLGIQPDFVGLGLISQDPMPALLETLGQTRTEAAMERGRQMSLEELVEFVETSIADPVTP